MSEVEKIKQCVADGYELLTIRKATRFELAGRYFVAIFRQSPSSVKTLIYLRAVPMGYEKYLDKKYIF